MGMEHSKDFQALTPECSHMQDADCELLSPGVISSRHVFGWPQLFLKP